MPIRITRVYTRTGDHGETALVGRRARAQGRAAHRGVRHGRRAERALGLARVFNVERLGEGEGHRWLDEMLRRLQNQLFDLGSELATPEDAAYEGMYRIGAGRGEGAREADRPLPEGAAAAQVVRAAGRRPDRRRSSTRRARCAAAPSGRSCGCRGASRSPSGRCAT